MMNKKQYPSNQYLESASNDLEFAVRVSSEAVAIMARELLSLRAQLAELAEQEPIGRVDLGEYDDCGTHPDATVVCLHEYADWENFQDDTELFTRAAPPAPVKLPKRMRIEGGTYCTAQAYYDESGDYYDRNDLLEALKAQGVEVADE